MKVITAPETYLSQKTDIKCFLAGGITNYEEFDAQKCFDISCKFVEEGFDPIEVDDFLYCDAPLDYKCPLGKKLY